MDFVALDITTFLAIAVCNVSVVSSQAFLQLPLQK